MDEASRHRRVSEFRCLARDTANRREATSVHDSGVEGRIQICCYAWDKLGLEMAIAGSPGWSESGGPWVPAKDGMKKYVWSETRVTGGRMFTGKLPQPPGVTGAFQNVPVSDAPSLAQQSKRPAFYEDTAVIAYRLP